MLSYLVCLAVADVGLRDIPIVADRLQYLDGAWSASAPTVPLTIPATVPGDLITDLQQANVIGDPLFELNFKNASIWNDHIWTYKTTFSVDLAAGTTPVLVFDGIKMHATITLNGQVLGTAADQYLRYTFPLASGLLKGSGNVLTVAFDPSKTVDGRFMACTGGWDWAPYSNTNQSAVPLTARTFSKGIWKSVYLIQVGSAALTYLVPHVFYMGEYPTAPLQDGAHGDFQVRTRVHFWAPAPTTGTLDVEGMWGGSASRSISLPSGDSNVTLTLTATAQQICLWWPNGVGEHPMYNVLARFTPSSGSPLATSRAIGFRLIVLVTGNDTDPDYVKASVDADGTSRQGMFFRVNGAAVYARGANMIPMEEMEGRMRADAHALLVQSAADANFNMLRVWGGGIFLPDVWYEACDALGIMVYHDMQYAQRGHSPSKTATQEAEFRHQIRRLSHHPSIAIWDGCNECHVIIGTDPGIYATFVLTVVVSEDSSRIVWPSCPAEGWTAGVNRLTVHPNGSPLGLRPALVQTSETRAGIEVHGPYQHGGGFPAVNGDGLLVAFDPLIPINISPQTLGVQYQNQFASEFGASVMSSFESMSPTLKPEHWGLHGGAPADKCDGIFEKTCHGDNVMAERNYPCDNVIDVYFGRYDFNATGEQAFKRQLYHCMLGQALLIKSRVETWRGSNMFGTVIWQFNEIWPTGGWGSVEYGTPVAGQVLGGRWKPLHYFLKASTFADVLATCGARQQCYVRNDSPFPFSGVLTLNAVSLATGRTSNVITMNLDLPAGPGAVTWFKIPVISASNEVLEAVIEKHNGTIVSRNCVPLLSPKALNIVKSARVSANVTGIDPHTGFALISVESTAPALYVTLTTLAHGRFSENAFLLTTAKVINFMPFGGPVNREVLMSTLRVEHLAMYAL